MRTLLNYVIAIVSCPILQFWFNFYGQDRWCIGVTIADSVMNLASTYFAREKDIFNAYTEGLGDKLSS